MNNGELAALLFGAPFGLTNAKHCSGLALEG